VSESTYGQLQGEEELPEVGRLVSHAFAGPVEGAMEWLRAAGLHHLRVLREGGSPVASLLRIPMGQFFGGKSVPMMGVAGVAVAPEVRGRGLARRLMQEALREMHAEGWPISALYPSTQALYRQVGYEQAGHRFMIRVPLTQIDVRERSAEVTALREGSTSAVEDCYRAFASSQHGWLDRGEYCWARVREMRGERYHAFGVPGQDGREGLDGYAFFAQRRKDSGRHDLIVSDVAFRTPHAGRRLLGLFADFATVGDELVLHGGPHHPLLWLLGQQRYTITLRDFWMLRITDVTRALEARGYATPVRAEVHVAIQDGLIDANARRFILRVEGGRGGVQPGGSAEVRLGANALAALWSGFATPAQLRVLGAIEGPDSALEALSGIFASGTPSMTEMF
jgi:predicted acetyltransferase